MIALSTRLIFMTARFATAMARFSRMPTVTIFAANLKRLGFFGCSVLGNPYGANTVDSTSCLGGGQQIYLGPWVGEAVYDGNYFDGGSDDMTDTLDLTRRPA